MNQGKIIEYIDQGKLICTLCLNDKVNRLHLLTASNREVNLSPKRAILISNTIIDTLKPREELLEKLKQTEEARNSLKAKIDVKELWELVRDEAESFDHKYLTQLIFGQTITDDHLSALVRVLFEDRLHFKIKDGLFQPNSEEKVEQILRQKEQEALKEEWLKQGSVWLKDIQQGKKPADPTFKDDIINLLIQLALYGNEKPDFKYGKELLSRADISDIRESRNLLIKLGVWEEDENLDLLRLGIEPSFTEKQMHEAVLLAEGKKDFQGLEDLRGLSAFTIDGPLTRDFDDAVSLEKFGDTLHLGIHIADISTAILPDSILDGEARDRASSIYMPCRQIPMIPPNLSQDNLCLKEGHDRQAISLLTSFDKSGNLLDYRFVPSVIRVQQHLTYEEVNEILCKGDLSDTLRQLKVEVLSDLLKEMYQISQHLRQKRINQDALSLSLPELQIKFNENSSLSLKLVDQDTPSRIIISEFMILYNWLAARFCRDNQIPILFRTQAKPSEMLIIGEEGYLYYVFTQRRKLSPLQINTAPNPHSGLGLDVYIHATSPIRRYLDLVSQRQIRAFLIGIAPICNEEQLEEIRTTVEPVLKDIEILRRRRLRYWILKFLSQNKGKKFKAQILDELKTKYRIIINDLLLVAEINKQEGVILSPGEKILVEVKSVDPWDDLVKFSYKESLVQAS